MKKGFQVSTFAAENPKPLPPTIKVRRVLLAGVFFWNIKFAISKFSRKKNSLICGHS